VLMVVIHAPFVRVYMHIFEENAMVSSIVAYGMPI
jgi:hypothetical protein